MQKFQIKHRITSKIIIEGEAENLKDFLGKNQNADLQNADLQNANLRGAKIKIIQQEDLIKSMGIQIIL